MIIYTVFFFTIFILSFKIKKTKFTIFDFILLATIILFSGLRIVGTDYSLYKRIFYSSFTLISRTGIGFNYFMYFVKYILNFNYQTLIFIISFLFNSSIYYFFKKNSEKPGLCMLIFISLGFYTTSFNMFRQSLSIAWVLLGSYFYNSRKPFKATLFFALAFIFHSSSLIAIVAYILINKIKHLKIKMRCVLPIFIFALIFYNQLFKWFINTFAAYEMYATYDSIPGLGTYLNVACYFVFTIIFILPKYKNNQSDDFRLYNLFLIGVCIMLLELKNFLFFRIAFYFTILSPIILSNFYIEHNYAYKKINSLLFYVLLYIYFIVYVSSFDGVMPYHSILW